MSIITLSYEKKAVQNNPRQEVTKTNRKPIKYLYEYIKQTNNIVLPYFNTTISNIIRDAVYYTVAVEYENYTIITILDNIDIAKPNAAQTLYYLLKDKRIPESKYEDYTDLIPMEMEKYCSMEALKSFTPKTT